MAGRKELSCRKELEELKRIDLQKLAKCHGIKANLKSDKLRDALCEVLFPPTSSGGDADNNSTNGKRRSKVCTPKPAIAAKLCSPLPLSEQKTIARKSIHLSANFPTPKSQNQSAQKKGKQQRRTFEKNDEKNPSKQRRGTFDKTESAEKPKKRRGTYDKDESEEKPKKRRGTYDKDDLEEKPSKRQCRGTVNKVEPSKVQISPADEGNNSGVKEMLSAMKDDMSDEQMKTSLMNILEKRVPHQEKADVGTNIPRFTGLSKAKESAKKPITPGNKNWEQIHQKNFDKMQSIDEYMTRKHVRSEQLSASMRKIKLARDKMKLNLENLKNYRTPPSVKKNAAKIKRTAVAKMPFSSPAAKPARTSVSKKPNLSSAVKPFVPSVTSVSKASFNFGNTRKSTIHTPRVGVNSMRKSPRLSASKENEAKSAGLNLSCVPKTTPFKFTGNTSIVGSLQKSFNLKESLAKPLSYKPHIGKLMPYSMNKTSIKEVTVKSKAERRMGYAKQRATSRNISQMKRRGIDV